MRLLRRDNELHVYIMRLAFATVQVILQPICDSHRADTLLLDVARLRWMH